MSGAMKDFLHTSLALLAVISLLWSVPAASTAAHHAVAEAKTANPVVLIKTSKGTIEAELYQDKAPITVANFLEYVNSGFYNGTIFHRVMPSFMIQGGGFDTDLKKKPTQAPIKNEATNGLKNDVGTLAMARTGVVDSATAQFFINTKSNAFLNHKDTTQRGYGYAVFGKVIGGMNVVKSIEDVKTARTGISEGQPVENVVIESITVKK
jgi:cyclophilin family peptidyl-prolyl cis-trans isomerase